jgi:hypothetical protein
VRRACLPNLRFDSPRSSHDLPSSTFSPRTTNFLHLIFELNKPSLRSLSFSMTANLPPNTVPLPFVTQLAPVVMTSTSSPDIKTTIEPNGPVTHTGTGSTQPTDNKDAASLKDAISIKAPSVMTADSAGNPGSPRTASTLPRYQFDRRDEKDAGIWIEKAHACVRQGRSS